MTGFPSFSVLVWWNIELSLVWFCGVVVIMSALHAEGREFEPRQNLFFLLLKAQARSSNLPGDPK